MDRITKSSLILSAGSILVFCLTVEAQTIQNAAAGDKVQSAASDTKTGTTSASTVPSAGVKGQENSFLKALASETAAQVQTEDDVPPSERLAKALLNATMQTNVFAKEVGHSIAGYVKEKQNEKERQELVDRFYFNCRQLMVPLRLIPQDYAELMRRVEWVYIEDGETGTPRFDTRTFRDLPNIIKKEHADMMLERVREGEVRTYHPNGTVKTVWRLQAGKPEGSVVTHYESGEILYIDIYKNGQKILRRKYDQEGKLEFEQPYSYTAEPLKSAEAPAVHPAAMNPAVGETVAVKEKEE